VCFSFTLTFAGFTRFMQFMEIEFSTRSLRSGFSLLPIDIANKTPAIFSIQSMSEKT